MMDINKLEQCAIELEKTLDIYSNRDEEAAALQADLKPLFELIREKKITTPMEWGEIPGRYRLTESGLQQYPEIENSFAAFSIELNGGASPVLDYIIEEQRKYNKKENPS
jgi:hypothetical protein